MSIFDMLDVVYSTVYHFRVEQGRCRRYLVFLKMFLTIIDVIEKVGQNIGWYSNYENILRDIVKSERVNSKVISVIEIGKVI